MENTNENIVNDLPKKTKGDEILEKTDETLKVVKESNQETLEAVKETAESVKELAENFKNYLDNQKELKSADINEEKITTGLKDANYIKNLEQKFNYISNQLLRGEQVENPNFLENSEFKGYLEHRIENECYGSPADKQKMLEGIVKEFKKVNFEKVNDTSKIIPILEKKDDSNVYRESVGSDGGFVARPTTRGTGIIDNYNTSYLRFRDMARVINISSMQYEEILSGKPEDAYWVGEENSTVDNKKNNFKQITIKVGELVRPTKITRKMNEDSAIDLVELISRGQKETMDTQEEIAFLVGDGTNDKPTGLFNSQFKEVSFSTYNKKTNSYDYEIDKFLTATVNKSADTKAEEVINKILYVKNALEDVGVNNMSIVMNTNDWQRLLTCKDGIGRYFIDTTMPANAVIKTLFGLPVKTSLLVPEMMTGGIYDDQPINFVSGTKGIFIGNIAQTYDIIDRLQIVSWVDAYTKQDEIQYFSRKRVGGRPYNFSKGAFLKVN